MDGRSEEIARNVARIIEQVRSACERVGRSANEVQIVAVSKHFGLTDIRGAYESGIRDFGENRVQELTGKVASWRATYPEDDITWHMIGHLQRNKAKDVIGNCALFHALDSFRLAETLQQRAKEADSVLDCLVQVNVSGEGTKSGFDPGAVDEAAKAVLALPNLRFRGLMALARPVQDPEDVRSEFAKLNELFDRMKFAHSETVDVLSMGMSGDFEVAIEEGATHIRVGTAIFGARM